MPEKPSKMEMVLDAEQVLQGALKADFEDVIVFGFKDGVIYTKVSRGNDCLKIIGALEVAKREFWEMPNEHED